MELSKMKPGILVAELVTSKGGIEYSRNYLEDYLDGPARKKKVETDIIIHNEEEFTNARNVKSRVYAKLRKICAKTPVGLICPKDKQEELHSTIKEIQQDVTEFNNEAKTIAIKARYAFYEVKEDNYATVAAITEQVADIARTVEEYIDMDDLTALKRAPRRILKGINPESIVNNLSQKDRDTLIAQARAELIRSAILGLNGIEELFLDETASEVKKLVKKARGIAKNIRRDVDKREKTLTQALSEVDLAGIKRIRTMFVLASMKADKKISTDEKSNEEDYAKVELHRDKGFVPVVPGLRT